jgi:hypothetical protein
MCDVAMRPTKPTSGSPCSIKALFGTAPLSTTLTGSDKKVFLLEFLDSLQLREKSYG